MNLQIDFKEYEAEEGQKQGDVRYEVKDMLSQLSYLENQYEQKRKTINRRKKNLHWSLAVYIGCAVFQLGIWRNSIHSIYCIYGSSID